MKTPSRSTLILTLAALALLGVALWYLRSRVSAPLAAPLAQTKPAPAAARPKAASLAVRNEAVAPSPVAAPGPAMALSPAAPAAPPRNSPDIAPIPRSHEAPSPSASPAPTPRDAAERPTEIAATARMYAAHAPLRTPEVADPDSPGNRRILQTMIGKALGPSRAAATPVRQ